MSNTEPTITIWRGRTSVRVPRQEIHRLVPFVADRQNCPLTEVDLAFVGPAEITQYNEQWMHHAGPTDVISFDLTQPGDRGLSVQLLICGEVAAGEAPKHGNSTRRELLTYVVHGLLHQMGLDDQTPEEFEAMKARQEEILREFERGK
ncbi:MAG: rRNA maturation RNase YbeY [Phycisphaerae bacterium]